MRFYFRVKVLIDKTYLKLIYEKNKMSWVKSIGGANRKNQGAKVKFSFLGKFTFLIGK